MKKLILMFAAAGLLLATPSCKKGENDPFMSFKSRKGRLSGTWHMTMMSTTSTGISSWGGNTYTTTTTTTYDSASDDSVRTSQTQLIDGANPTNFYWSMNRTEEHIFNKDGSYEMTRITDGNTEQASGYWAFVGKSKTTDLGKKEAVMITYTQEISNGNTDNYEGNAMWPDGYWLLDRLTGKELVVKVDYTENYSGGDSYTQTGTMTFAKQ